MKAAILHQPGVNLSIEDVEVDAPCAHEVLIETRAVGLCRSDLHFIDGTFPMEMPTIPGHEAAGIVRAVGDKVTRVKPGDHVVTFLAPSCGECRTCRAGQPTLCQEETLKRKDEEGSRLHYRGEALHQYLNLSAFAEQMLIHERACVAIDKKIPFDRAALIGCSVTTGSSTIFRECKVRKGDTVAVIGAGGIGLSAINAAKIAGAKEIIAIDLLEDKLSLAKEMGATHIYSGDRPDLIEIIQANHDNGVDFAIEAVGTTQTTELAWHILRRGGQATILGLIAPDKNVQLPGLSLLAGKSLKTSLLGNAHIDEDMPQLVQLYQDGVLDLDRIITKRIPLEEINAAFDHMRQEGEDARAVILFNQDMK